jgi:hypothetical protein
MLQRALKQVAAAVGATCSSGGSNSLCVAALRTAASAASPATRCSISGSSRGLHNLAAPPTGVDPLPPLQQQQQQPHQEPAWPSRRRSGLGTDSRQHNDGGGGLGGSSGGNSGPVECGHPKDKISRHRAGNRRRIYYKKPQGLLAFCRWRGQGRPARESSQTSRGWRGIVLAAIRAGPDRPLVQRPRRPAARAWGGLRAAGRCARTRVRTPKHCSTACPVPAAGSATPSAARTRSCRATGAARASACRARREGCTRERSTSSRARAHA